MSRVLFVTWDGGGNVPPQMGLIRGVAAEGHDVCVLTDASHEEWAADAAGGAERVSTYAAFGPEPGMPAANPTAYWFARRTAEGVRTVLAAEDGADVIVIDNMLASALAAAEVASVPSIAVFHQPWSFYYGGGMTKTWLDGTEFCNLIRTEMGLAPVARAQDVWDGCAAVLVTSPRSFDVAARELSLPANVRWVGPIVDDPPGMATVALPPGDDPLVVVSLSTHDMGQGPLLAALSEGLAAMPVRALVTVGFGIEPGSVPAAPNVVVTRYANHLATFDGARAVVTHAGHGTVMAALARGVPLVCVPLGRDQHDMANFVFQLGCGLTVDGEAAAEIGGITGALDAVLSKPTYRDAAGRMAADIDPDVALESGVRLILDAADQS